MTGSEILASDWLVILCQPEFKQPAQPIIGDEPPQRHHFDPISASEQLLVRDFSPVPPHSIEHFVQLDQFVHPAELSLSQQGMTS